MKVHQDLAALPYARHLRPFTGELERDEDYTGAHLDGAEFDDVRAGNTRFDESVFTGTTFTGGDLGRARFSDVWMARTRWIGAGWVEADLLDVTILDSVLAGVQAHGGTWRRVVLQGCKIDSLNLRATRLQDVEFRDCDLTEVDFGSATLTGVTFPGSAIRRARFGRVTVKKLDFRGCRGLDVADGWDALRGAVIDHDQLAEAAPALAQTLGIVVR
ncbi:pentapeptide repeat-containing protein [Actinoplanes teichomyceticus]|uniref:Uncharacterized protein YjbI with pentapeptide repeats n=1 Tax=Actinoplanes teichomyceticus TaxID=1867 RepID=A0A561VKU5_ACTTI|nr:pentapeptide repeat-containing protein [Actinoplanes teichomyceticus]TWG12236.1 uncharacterized protein YjbI with pentapeptide repeats [Actinoplanes teichomyceticus]GIF14172.1 hypothetical protein Ate01nite_42040 [Actinoplanes teichomyceticus]